MKDMKCIKEYKGLGFLRNDEEKSIEVDIKIDDTIKCDQYGYLWLNDICFGHKDAALRDYFE